MFGFVKDALIAAVLCAAAIPCPALASTFADPLPAETAAEPVPLSAHFAVGVRELSVKNAAGKNEFATCAATIRALIRSAMEEANPEQVLAVRQGRFAPEALVIIFVAGPLALEPEAPAAAAAADEPASRRRVMTNVSFMGSGRSAQRYLDAYVAVALRRQRIERVASKGRGASVAVCAMRGRATSFCLLRASRGGVAMAAGYEAPRTALTHGIHPEGFRTPMARLRRAAVGYARPSI